MRYLLLALMIALVPLRGWVGDAMAMQMAVAPIAHTHEAGASAPVHAGSPRTETAVADCAGHTGSGNPSPSDPSHCQSCVACQVCNTAALAVQTFAIGATVTPLEVPHSAAPRFTSAERALGLKPPIS